MLTAAACVTEVVAYGRSLPVVLAKLRQGVGREVFKPVDECVQRMGDRWHGV